MIHLMDCHASIRRANHRSALRTREPWVVLQTYGILMRLTAAMTFALLAALAPSGAPTIACASSDAAAFAWWPGTWNYSVPHFDPGITR